MAAADPFTIVVAIAKHETGQIRAATLQLAESMSGAVGESLQVRAHSIARDAAVIPTGSLFLASLTEDVQSDEDLESIEQAWRTRLARVQDAGLDRVLLCTLFRCVARGPQWERKLERIRRLNQLIVALSLDLGCEIADVDRLLALFGGRLVGADYRCLSRMARRIAGQAIAAAILDGEMYGYLEPEAQQRAIALHGGVHNLREIMIRHRGTGG